MNCGDFRYLIQRRFDIELSPSDDRALLIHLEACESCQKFYHQVQQIIIAAEEMNMPENLLPPQPEFLANKIFQIMPHEESGISALVSRFLSRFSFLRSLIKIAVAGPEYATGEKETLTRLSAPSALKRSSSVKVGDWGAPSEVSLDKNLWTGRAGMSETAGDYDDRGGSMQQAPEQTITRSLGEKFGLSASGQSEGGNAVIGQPLTLAESIRRRIAEIPKPAMGKEIDQPALSNYQGVNTAAEDVEHDSDILGGWGVPHSPNWPKIEPNLHPDKALDKAKNIAAPDSWGKAVDSWGSQPRNQDQQPANYVSDNQNPGGWIEISAKKDDNKVFSPEEIRQMLEAIPDDAGSEIGKAKDEYKEERPLSEQRNWSAEAEQMETGTWESVEFNTASAVTPDSPSGSSVPSITSSTSSPATAVNADDSQWQLSIQERLARQQAGLAGQANLTPGLESPIPKTAESPRIYPVVSKHVKSSSPSDLLQGLDDNVLDNFQPPPTAVPSTETTKPVSEIAMPETKAAENPGNDVSDARLFNLDEADVDKLFSENLGIDDKSVSVSAHGLAAVPPSSTVPVKDQVSLPAEPQVSTSNVSQPTNLFAVDDKLIDRIFSRNLGVPQQVDSIPSGVNNLPAATMPQAMTPSTAVPSTPVPSATTPPPAVPPRTVLPVMTPSIAVPSTPVPSATTPPPAVPPRTVLPVMTPSTAVPSAPVPSAATPPPAVPPRTVLPVIRPSIPPPPATSPSIAIPPTVVPPTAAPSAIRSPAPEPPTMTPPTITPPTITPSVLAQPVTRSSSVIRPSITQPPVGTSPTMTPPVINVQDQLPFQENELNLSPPQTEPTPGLSASKQKIASVGRLDSRAEAPVAEGSGRIAAIGKFLLDNQDLERIGKLTASDLSESNMRTLSLEAHRELSNLLKQIDSQVGVIGTMIIGHDGLLIATTIPQDLEAESLSKWAHAIYMGTAQVAEQLGSDNVRQIVLQTERGYLIIAKFDAGVLIALTNPFFIDNLLPLMRTITQLIAT